MMQTTCASPGENIPLTISHTIRMWLSITYFKGQHVGYNVFESLKTALSLSQGIGI